MRATGSWLILRLVQAVTLILLLLWGGGLRSSPPKSDVQRFLDEAARRWCEVHGRRGDLQIAVVDVHFRPEPPQFDENEGVVVTPVSLNIPGLQRTIEVASFPPQLRRLEAEGISALSWAYPGRRNRDLRFVGLALVEREATQRSVAPTQPTYDMLPVELREKALARAADLEEHALHKCAAFAAWARRTAGEPPYTDQILRLVSSTAKRPAKQPDREDICAGIRKGQLTAHWAQVAVVMGAREVGIPAMGFSSAAPKAVHLVGTFTDQMGWVFAAIEQPEAGWYQGGPALLTQAPLLGKFSASQHEFWYPQAAAYALAQWGEFSVSSTEWQGLRKPGDKPAHTTEARSLALAEACQ